LNSALRNETRDHCVQRRIYVHGPDRCWRFYAVLFFAAINAGVHTRGRDGKLLTDSQIQWGEFRRFAEQASMSEINLRKQSDPEFANFVRKNLQREMQEQPVGDSVVNLNQRVATVKKGVSADVVAYAARYRVMSSDAVRKELSPGINPLGPAAAAEANRLFEAACAAGLI
jgi:hypothetical protein